MSFPFDLHSVAVSDSHLPCHAHAMLRPCRSSQGHSTAVEKRPCCAMALRRTAWAWHGMASVKQTRPHCVNQMVKTHSKPLAARHGRGTAWAWHVMCVNGPLVGLQDFKLCCRAADVWTKVDEVIKKNSKASLLPTGTLSGFLQATKHADSMFPRQWLWRLIFRNVTPCMLLIYRRFGKKLPPCSIQVGISWRQYILPNRRRIYITLDCVTSHKTVKSVCKSVT